MDLHFIASLNEAYHYRIQLSQIIVPTTVFKYTRTRKKGETRLLRYQKS